MDTTNTDRIEKQIVLRAPPSRVWRALSDSKEFGAWFGVELAGPFTPGERLLGRIVKPKGYEDLTWEIVVDRVEPERLLSFRWHPYAIDPKVDYSKEPSTLVVFTVEAAPEGTRLTVVESGFDALPAERRADAFRMNGMGWGIQLKNVEDHVAAHP